jgi:hypothetical protein
MTLADQARHTLNRITYAALATVFTQRCSTFDKHCGQSIRHARRV